MAFTDNIKEITPAITQLKSNTPVIVIDGKIYVAGIGGNFIPGNAAASQSGTANIAAGYITISDSVITVHNVTDGTISTTDKLYIADTGVEEPAYQSGEGSATSMAFYKCAAVYSDSTWSGYKYDAEKNITNTSSVQLTYAYNVPAVGNYYTQDALAQVTIAIPPDPILYLHLANNTTNIVDSTDAYIVGTVQYMSDSGVKCINTGTTGGLYAANTSISGDSPWSISCLVKIIDSTQTGYLFQLGADTGSTGSYINCVYRPSVGKISLSDTREWSDIYTQSVNSWQHICLTWNGSTIIGYINGSLSMTRNTSLNIYNNAYVGLCGCSVLRGSINAYGNVKAAQIKLFTRALSQTEIVAQYNRLHAMITSN